MEASNASMIRRQYGWMDGEQVEAVMSDPWGNEKTLMDMKILVSEFYGLLLDSGLVLCRSAFEEAAIARALTMVHDTAKALGLPPESVQVTRTEGTWQ